MLETTLEVFTDDTVTFEFTVSNAGGTPIELTFHDACRVDFVVYEGETVVWRYSDGRAFAQSLTAAELQPGEAASFEEVWSDPRPGEYVAEAILCVRERNVSEQTQFSV